MPSDFIKIKYPDMWKTYLLAKDYIESDPNSCISKIGVISENMVSELLNHYKIEWMEKNQNDRLQYLKNSKIIEQETYLLLNQIRKLRNLPSHELNNLASTDSQKAIVNIEKLFEWFESAINYPRNLGHIADCFKVNTGDNNIHTYGYIVGNLSEDLPFLYQTKSGGLLTPMYLSAGDRIGCVGDKSVIYSNNKIESYAVPKIDETLNNLKPPSISLHLSTDEYIKASLIPEFKELEKQIYGNGVIVYVPIIGFDEVAIRLYQEAQKGDMLSCYGELKRMVIKTPYTKIMCLWLTDARIIQKANGMIFNRISTQRKR